MNTSDLVLSNEATRVTLLERSRSRGFWAIVALQAVFLLAWAGYHEQVRGHAPVVLLRAQPVDPQDLLRGDYMILRYDLSSPAGLDLGKYKAGESVWVRLARKETYYEAVAVDTERMAAGPEQYVVRGEIARLWRDGSGQPTIRYGIEEYFVPEGKGTPRFKTMEVEAAVSPVNRLYIRQLFLDGKAYP